jgi:glutathione S-transferase
MACTHARSEVDSHLGQQQRLFRLDGRHHVASANIPPPTSSSSQTATSTHQTTTMSAFTKYSKTDQAIKILYFDGRGAMELPRLILAAGGKFAGEDFEDCRFPGFAEFGAAQASGELGHTNMNRVPLMVDNGVTIGETSSICRHAARIGGIMGSTDLEAAQIDNIFELASETTTAWGAVFPYGNKFDDEKKAGIIDKWFSTAGDSTERADRQLKWHLKHIEAVVGSDGYAFGGKASLADAKIYHMLGEVCTLSSGATSYVFALDSEEKINEIFVGFPKLKKIVDTFKTSENLVKYFAARGTPNF